MDNKQARQDNGVRAYKDRCYSTRDKDHASNLLITGDYYIRWCETCQCGYYSDDGDKWTEMKHEVHQGKNQCSGGKFSHTCTKLLDPDTFYCIDSGMHVSECMKTHEDVYNEHQANPPDWTKWVFRTPNCSTVYCEECWPHWAPLG